MNRLKWILALGAVSFLILGLGKPRHSKIKVEQKPDGKGELVLSFTVSANEGYKPTEEGPWELTFSDPTDLSISTKAKKKKDRLIYDQYTKAGKSYKFEVRAKPVEGKRSGTLSFKLKSFICKEDKTGCYPEIHKGKVSWEL